MKILVTGGNGQLGLNELPEDKAQNVNIDNFVTGKKIIKLQQRKPSMDL